MDETSSHSSHQRGQTLTYHWHCMSLNFYRKTVFVLMLFLCIIIAFYYNYIHQSNFEFFLHYSTFCALWNELFYWIPTGECEFAQIVVCHSCRNPCTGSYCVCNLWHDITLLCAISTLLPMHVLSHNALIRLSTSQGWSLSKDEKRKLAKCN